MHWLRTIPYILIAFAIHAEAIGISTAATVFPDHINFTELASDGTSKDDAFMPVTGHLPLNHSLYSETVEEVQEESECNHSGSGNAATILKHHLELFALRSSSILKDRSIFQALSTPIFILNRALLN